MNLTVEELREFMDSAHYVIDDQTKAGKTAYRAVGELLKIKEGAGMFTEQGVRQIMELVKKQLGEKVFAHVYTLRGEMFEVPVKPQEREDGKLEMNINVTNEWGHITRVEFMNEDGIPYFVYRENLAKNRQFHAGDTFNVIFTC